MKITKRQLKRIIKEEREEIRKRTSNLWRSQQEQDITGILNKADDLLEKAFRIALDMEENEDSQGMDYIVSRVNRWHNSYGRGD
jgi:transcriptional regulator of heat shock response